MYFVNGARDPIGRREFPLLQTSFDVNVLALLVRHRNVRDFVVKDQAVPVRVGLGLTIAPGKARGFTETDVGNLRSGREVSEFRLRRQITSQFDAVLLHRL